MGRERSQCLLSSKMPWRRKAWSRFSTASVTFTARSTAAGLPKRTREKRGCGDWRKPLRCLRKEYSPRWCQVFYVNGSCDATELRPPFAGDAQGAVALLWGEPAASSHASVFGWRAACARRGGNPPAPSFPLGETGKGTYLLAAAGSFPTPLMSAPARSAPASGWQTDAALRASPGRSAISLIPSAALSTAV